MNLERLKFKVDYEGLLSAQVDWVAGGNFDGYVYKTILCFYEDGKVIRTLKILDQSRYDGYKNGSESIGTFRASDTDTITCSFENHIMRGKILGDKDQYLAFSVYGSNYTECYELKV
jgi:hypothetical protein